MRYMSGYNVKLSKHACQEESDFWMLRPYLIAAACLDYQHRDDIENE